MGTRKKRPAPVVEQTWKQIAKEELRRLNAHVGVEDLDDAFSISEEDEETCCETKKPEIPKDACEKWVEWWRLGCDHPASPEIWQAWDGAIDTLCHYLTNEFCGSLGLDEVEVIMRKAKKKFKNYE